MKVFWKFFFDDVTITINPFGKSDNRYYTLDSLTNPILKAKCTVHLIDSTEYYVANQKVRCSVEQSLCLEILLLPAKYKESRILSVNYVIVLILSQR